MKSFIAVDGGGTKTEVLLVDTLGNVCFRTIVECTNPNDVTMDRAVFTLKNALFNALNEASNKNLEVVGIYLLIAGIEFGDSKAVLKERLSKELNFEHIVVDGDLASVKEAGLGKDKDGVVVIAGTGSNMAIKENNKFTNIGGWGYLADTHLCGFTLGREALIASSKAINGVGEKTILVNLLEDHFKSTLWYAMAEIYQGGVKRVASLAPIVIDAYKKNDKVAKELINTRIECLARDIKNNTTGIKGPVKVCLFGGIFENNKFICDELSTCLGENYKITIVKKKTIQGAVYFAIKDIEKRISDEFEKNFDSSYKI